MEAYPLSSIDLTSAMQKQFKLVDKMTHHFVGTESLNLGDLGVAPPNGLPKTTYKVEKTIADFFGTTSAMLVRGAGTNAIRLALHSCLKPEDNLLVHTSPIYSTTKTTIELLNINPISANFNNYEEVLQVIKMNSIKGILVQLTRQKLEDNYDYEALIRRLKDDFPDIPIVTDDNYAVMKVNNIGVECGADLSCFSTFKLLGPQGIGCIVGNKHYIEQLKKENYSGGSQVQGFEALEVLRGMVYAPVALAISNMQAERVVNVLSEEPRTEIREVTIVNAQSKVIIVSFKEPIAKLFLELAPKYGAAPYPIGAESKFEIVPMFYRVSGTFLKSNPAAEDYYIRINPMRASAETIISIIDLVLGEIDSEGKK